MNPKTRKEQFYNGILSGGGVPEPITREEQYLAKIAEQGGGGGATTDTYTKEQINTMFAEADDKYLPKSAIVKLDSMEEFNNLSEKTADWYFIKEG